MEFSNVSDHGVVVSPTPDEAPGIVNAIREVCRARELRLYDPMLGGGKGVGTNCGAHPERFR